MMMNKGQEEYVKYEVKGDFDRNSIAQKFEMTVDQLIAFHNKNCHLMERLGKDLPYYLPHVYIPADKYKKYQNGFIKSTQLSLPLSTKSRYGVKISYTPSSTVLHYKIKVERERNNILLDKEKVYVNNKEVHKVIEEFMQMVERSFYPLELQTNKFGAIKKINNAKQIQERWKKIVLPKVQIYYQSELIEVNIKKIDDGFKKLNASPKDLGRSIFYQLFCLPVFRNYLDFSDTFNTSIYFSELKEDINFKINCFLDSHYSRGKKIVLRLKGKEEAFLNDDQPLGKIDLVYKFNPTTHSIFSITGHISTFHYGKEHLINFNLFEIH